MAALRYSSARTAVRDGAAQTGWRLSNGEGDEAKNDDIVASEGGVAAMRTDDGEDVPEERVAAETTNAKSMTTVQLGLELTDELSTDLGSVAKVRTVVKRARRDAKRRRAQRALQRKRAAGDDEVSVLVAALDEEQHVRRRQQADEAQRELVKRQDRRRCDDQTHAQRRERCAQVRLVQRAQDDKVTSIEVEDALVAADNGLPTARMDVSGARYEVKLDSGARYSVADVIGVWRFEMRNAFSQIVQVEACIIEGCTDEFLIGVDFTKRHKANMDFEQHEIRYYERKQLVVIPFRTNGVDGTPTVATVRLVRRARIVRNAVTPVEISVAATDGEEGIFVPNDACGAVLLAATVTTVKNGKALVPAINMRGDKTKLPSKK
ncbi:hypothetical protein PInf_024194 [Phytophthora infestans]|nr:hypothetical protein PInf_024194 [Phytophthora infestans]